MLVLQDISRVKNLNGLTNEKFLVIMLAMLWMSVAAFSQITQEDYEPNETRTQIETTEKAIKGEIKEVSEYANLGKEIGVAVNETLKAVEDSAIRIQPRTNSNNYRSMEITLQRDSRCCNRYHTIRNISIYATNW